MWERLGNKGVPTVKELLEKLDRMNKGMESEHAQLLKGEFAAMEQRVKSEFARLDIRVNTNE